GVRAGSLDIGLGDAVFQAIGVRLVEVGAEAQSSMQGSREVSGLLLKVARSRAAAPSLARQHQTRLTELALLAYNLRRYREAAPVIASLKQPIPARNLSGVFGLDEAHLRQELSVLNSPAGIQNEPLKTMRTQGRSA